MLTILEQTAETAPGGWGFIIIMAVFFVAMYFLMIRPQKKEQKKHDALIRSLEVGDCVVTTSGFYGVVIDVMEEVIVVEFGNNKNCRIPMKKGAVVEVEKPGTEASKTETK